MKHLILGLGLLTTFYSLSQISGQTAYYSFAGSAQDGEQNNDGVVHNAQLTTDRFGNDNHAYQFNDGAYIALPHSTALKSTEMTISLWAKKDTTIANYQFIYSVVNAYSGANFCSAGISLSSSNTYFVGSQNSSGPSAFTTGTHTNAGDWQHVVLAYNSSNLYFYVDGQLDVSVAKSFSTVYTNDSVFIGKSGHNSFGTYFTGAIDDIRVFNRVLDSAEVQELLNEPNPTLGMEDLTNKTLEIHPNPAQDVIHLNPTTATTISIRSLDGTVVYSAEIDAPTTIKIDQLAAGVYVVQTADGQTQRFIKH